MIKVNDRFSFVRGQYDWQLHETYLGKDKDGNPKPQTKISYYPNIKQVASAIMDKSSDTAESLTQLIDTWNILERDLTKELESIA